MARKTVRCADCRFLRLTRMEAFRYGRPPRIDLRIEREYHLE